MVICIPSGITEVEMRAVKNLLKGLMEKRSI
jgi:actin-like ATPase involved in cell morphogenesis